MPKNRQSMPVSEKPSNSNKMAQTPFPLQGPRGMPDILPAEQKYWEYVVETAKMVFRGWDFQRIDTPIMEETSLFKRAVGDETDIVNKELFELKGRGHAYYSLRPEGTAPVVRAYIEHGMRRLPKPIKLFYTGPFFRYERPQKGRFRQHYQIGLEIFGSASPATEVEIIYIEHSLLQQLGLENYVFKINSLGQPADRQVYIRALKDHYRHHQSKLCKDCKERLATNPLRVLDCKQEKCQQVANIAPVLLDYLSEESKQHFTRVLKMLDGLGVPFVKTPFLVRGLDYYTHTVWEIEPKIVNPDALPSSQGSLGGGGRYDGLMKQLGGKDTPAVGASHGIERLIEQVRVENIELTVADGPQIFVAQLSESAKITALKVMRQLQEAQIRFSASVDRDGMQPQLKLASRLGVTWVVVIGQKEAIDGSVILRNMESGMQEVVLQKDLVKELNRRLNIGEI